MWEYYKYIDMGNAVKGNRRYITTMIGINQSKPTNKINKYFTATLLTLRIFFSPLKEFNNICELQKKSFSPKLSLRIHL